MAAILVFPPQQRVAHKIFCSMLLSLVCSLHSPHSLSLWPVCFSFYVCSEKKSVKFSLHFSYTHREARESRQVGALSCPLALPCFARSLSHSFTRPPHIFVSTLCYTSTLLFFFCRVCSRDTFTFSFFIFFVSLA